MADTVFNGFCGLNTEALGAEIRDLSAFTTSVALDPGRTLIDHPPTFSLDHQFDITGSSFATITATFLTLPPADKLLLINNMKDKDLMEILYRPLTGVASATNLETRAQFQLMNHPVIIAELDTLDTWELGAIRVVGYIITDGASPVQFGTILST